MVKNTCYGLEVSKMPREIETGFLRRVTMLRKKVSLLLCLVFLCGVAFGVDPIARYDFEGDPNDTQGTYDLTVTGTITYDGTDMKVGSNSGLFDGSSFGTAALPDLNQQTYAFWLYPTASSYALSRDASVRFDVRLISGEVLVYIGGSLYFDTRSTGTLDVPFNEWTHVVITLNESATTASLYFNKILWQTRTDVSKTISGEPLFVGARAYSGGTSPLQGKLDDMRVYNTVLSPAEIVQLPPVANTAPIVKAGADGLVYLDDLTLDLGTANGASAIDDGLPDPPALLTHTWSCDDLAVTFTDIDGINATANFPTPTAETEDYVLKLIASDGVFDVNDVMTVTVCNGTSTGLLASYNFESNLLDEGDLPYFDFTEQGGASTYVDGIVGAKAISYSASTFNYATADVLPTANFTIAFAAKMVGGSPATIPNSWGPVNRYDGSGLRMRCLAYSGDERFMIYDGGSAICDLRGVNGDKTFTTNEWTHMALTYDGSTYKLYIDSVLAWQRDRVSDVMSWTHPLQIGGYSDATSVNGDLDDLRYYDHVLTALEVRVLAAGMGLDFPPLVDAQVSGALQETIYQPADTVSMDGSAYDEDAYTVQWTSDGPAAVTFSAATSEDTNATFTQVGDYTLTLTATDSTTPTALSASDVYYVKVRPSTWDGLVAYFSMESDATSSENGIAYAPAVLEGGTSFVAGKVGSGALYFNGATSISYGNFLGSDPNLTAMLWYKTDNADDGATSINDWLMSKWDGENGKGWTLRTRSNSGDPNTAQVSGLIGSAFNGPTWDIRGPYGELKTGVWHHLALVYEGVSGSNVMKVYQDGILIGQGDDIEFTPDDILAPMNFGARYAASGNATAAIDDVYIYDHALTTQQIRSYITGVGGTVWSPTPCAGDLTFDYDGNCKVELNDFAVLASLWLDSVDDADLRDMVWEWLECDNVDIEVCPGFRSYQSADGQF
jgi:hypothetical protein